MGPLKKKIDKKFHWNQNKNFFNLSSTLRIYANENHLNVKAVQMPNRLSLLFLYKRFTYKFFELKQKLWCYFNMYWKLFWSLHWKFEYHISVLSLQLYESFKCKSCSHAKQINLLFLYEKFIYKTYVSFYYFHENVKRVYYENIIKFN